jgi:hypothetical protein
MKYNEDIVYSNNHFSKVAGVSILEVNFLESHLLELLSYELFISEEQYKECLDYLLNSIMEETNKLTLI